VYFDEAYAPFGEHYSGVGTSDLSFTGQTQDTVTGLYDFPFRQEHPVQGRWLVPDPAGLAAVDITNPQTWNRYAYLANNPLTFIDPLGLYLMVCPIQRNCPVGGYSDAGAMGAWGDLMSADFWGTEGNDSTTFNSVYYSLNFGGGGSGPVSPGTSVCNNIPSGGRTVPVPLGSSPQSGTINFQFNGQGNLIGLGVSLTTTTPASVGNISVPANTVAGFTLLSPGTVQFGFTNPVQVGSGVAQAYVQTLTFSGGKYTSATGALAPFGIPLGSSTGSSSLLPWILNGNAPFSSSIGSQASQFGNFLTGLATLVSKSVSCQSLFGGKG
jgi:RHS repeat-associated protein